MSPDHAYLSRDAGAPPFAQVQGDKFTTLLSSTRLDRNLSLVGWRTVHSWMRRYVSYRFSQGQTILIAFLNDLQEL